MRNNKTAYFTVNCGINEGEQLSINLPYTTHSDFQRTVCSGDSQLISRLATLFAEFELLDPIKRDTFQALILQRANEVSTLDDLLVCMAAVKTL